MTFDSDQLTLTCISTGGPATAVTWTRDSANVTQGTETVLNDPVTAQYTHTLAVTAFGAYTCSVSNAKPSSASATITLGVYTPNSPCYVYFHFKFNVSSEPSPPTGVTAAQRGPTSIEVTWNPPVSPLNGITGYEISYSGGSTGSVNVAGENANSHTLTGLTNGRNYTISIVATSSTDLVSESVATAVRLGK